MVANSVHCHGQSIDLGIYDWDTDLQETPITGIVIILVELLKATRVETESDGTQRSTGGEVKGKEVNGVGSQHSCTLWEHGLSSITTADAHTSAASSRLNWHPRRYKWTRPFRWKTKSGFCACAITFRFHSTNITFPCMWCGVIGDQLIGPYIFSAMSDRWYLCQLLQDELPALLENVPLQTWQMYRVQQKEHPDLGGS